MRKNGGLFSSTFAKVLKDNVLGISSSPLRPSPRSPFPLLKSPFQMKSPFPPRAPKNLFWIPLPPFRLCRRRRQPANGIPPRSSLRAAAAEAEAEEMVFALATANGVWRRRSPLREGSVRRAFLRLELVKSLYRTCI